MLLACEGVQEDDALLMMRGHCWRQVCVCVLWVLPRTMCIRHGGVCVRVSCRQICMCVYLCACCSSAREGDVLLMICGRHWREVCVNGVGRYALSLALGVCKW